MSREAKSVDTDIKVMRWGPLPHRRGVFGGGIGGYARYNSQALRSSLAQQVRLIPVPMTVPRFRSSLAHRLHLFVRMIQDVAIITASLLFRRPQVLHITALYWRSIYRESYAVWLAKRLGIAVFYDIRAGYFEQFASERKRLSGALTRFVMQKADAIGVQGRGLVEFIDKEFGREANWIPNCFLNKDLQVGCRASPSSPGQGEPLRLVYLGYLIPEKGVDVLLQAAHKLSATLPVEVTLIGELHPGFSDTLREFQARQCERFSVVTTGRLELEELLEVLGRQHVFVFLSRFFGEGHPNAVNEAMAMGLPVVASRQGFLDDVVDENSGVLVDDPLDVERVCRVLEDLYRDRDRLQSLSEGARRRVTTTFGEDEVLSRTADIYRRCSQGAS